MSAFSPPIYYFADIDFDSAYFVASVASDFTAAQADALYLRKTVPDTATQLETFSLGISTPSITNPTTLSINPAGDLTMGTSSNTINIGTSLGYNYINGQTSMFSRPYLYRRATNVQSCRVNVTQPLFFDTQITSAGNHGISYDNTTGIFTFSGVVGQLVTVTASVALYTANTTGATNSLQIVYGTTNPPTRCYSVDAMSNATTNLIYCFCANSIFPLLATTSYMRLNFYQSALNTIYPETVFSNANFPDPSVYICMG